VNRIDLINTFIRTRNYTRYLEIGCAGDTSFHGVSCKEKVGVDPARGGTLRMTSDEFFTLASEPFDIILVDGDHAHPQVHRDVGNGLRLLKPGGVLVMHDCLPPTREHEGPGFCGTAWRAFAKTRELPDLESYCLDLDWGVGIVERKRNTSAIRIGRRMDDLSYSDFLKNREAWMRPVSSDQVALLARSGLLEEAHLLEPSKALLVLGKSTQELSAFCARNPHAASEARLVLVANPNKVRGGYAAVANTFLDTVTEDIVGVVHADTTFGVGVLRSMFREAVCTGGRLTGMAGRSFDSFVWGKDGGGEVSTLDSCAVMMPRGLGLRFDGELFDDFHCCVEDLCLQALKLGVQTYVPPLYAEHLGFIDRPADWMTNYWRYRTALAAKWPGIRFITTGEP
jgi:SAM-dependent methyltransferase